MVLRLFMLKLPSIARSCIDDQVQPSSTIIPAYDQGKLWCLNISTGHPSILVWMFQEARIRLPTIVGS
ncbi:hypothetical protein GCM10008022_13350 [Paenibacillus hunanensis]|nr:hypothetical protein GCM10008022_13350 [Paenibacillus hunanensis]